MMRWSLLCMWLAALGVSPETISSDARKPGAGAAYTVIIENMEFKPRELHVARGARIVWVNKDLFPHTVTALSRVFDSGSIAANSSWTYVAKKKGEYAYGCTFHPGMRAKLDVE